MYGFLWATDNPAAKVIACSSVIPTSKLRLGYFLKISPKQLPEIIAGVITTISSSSFINFSICEETTALQLISCDSFLYIPSL